MDSDYWQKLAALKPTIFDGAGQKATALARGEVAVATTGSSATNVSVTEDKAPLEYVIPKEGLVTFDYYMGITSSAKNKEAAELFMNYNFSKHGQTLSTLGDYGVRTDVPTRSPTGTSYRLSTPTKYGG